LALGAEVSYDRYGKGQCRNYFERAAQARGLIIRFTNELRSKYKKIILKIWQIRRDRDETKNGC
jgi:hypothetical protein